MEAAQRKQKSGRLKRRMRGALSKLGGPMRRRPGRDHVTDDAQRLVGNEQLPEVELDIVASTSEPEPVCPPCTDQPKKQKNPILAKLVSVTAKFGRRKSTSGSEGKGKRDRKKRKKTRAQSPAETSSNPMPSGSGLFESESDRLIEAEPETEIETSTNDDVSSAVPAASLHAAKTPEERQTDVEREEEVRHSDDKDAASGPEVNYVTEQEGDTKKHGKRKQAKRYAKRAGVTAWKGVRSSWKFISSSLTVAALSTSTAFTMNATSGIAAVWQQWRGVRTTHTPPPADHHHTARY